jgi:hypothetical protein
MSRGRNQLTNLVDVNGGFGSKNEEANEEDSAPTTISNGLLQIRSRILDTEVWVVPDGWTGELDGPTYTDSEIRELVRLQPIPEELRAIHRTKVQLDGKVMRLSEADQLLQTIDPFDRDNYLGVGKVVELPDLDYEGRYTAHRVGSWPPEAIGHGDTVLEAVDELLALEDLESTEPR